MGEVETQNSVGSPKKEEPSQVPRVEMACVVSAEVAAVLTVMRRNVRWAGGAIGGIGVRYGGGDDEDNLDHSLIRSLKSLRRQVFLWDRRHWHAVDPILYLQPFLDLIRSDETGAPITGAALSSVHKILAVDVLDLGTVNVAAAMHAVVDAVTSCRFEVTDPASEEAVLMKILHVLLACIRSRAAAVLSNRHVCTIVNTCFRVVQQAGTKGELLQRISRHTMQELIRCIFTRLPDMADSTIEEPSLANGAGSSGSQEVSGVDKDQGYEVKKLENGDGDYVTLTSSGDEMDMHDMKDMMEPYGIPCIVEIFHFLCSLLNIADDIEMNPRMSQVAFDEDVPLFALGLINLAIELGGSSIHRHPKLLALVHDDLFFNLVQFGLSMSPLILSMVCSIVLNLYYQLRKELKLQLEAFFSCVILRLAQSRHGASYQQQEVAMEVLVDFCRQKSFMAEMFANMDCDIRCNNVFEDLINLLSKNAFPVNSPLSSLHVLALDGLVAVIQGIAERIESGPQCPEHTLMEIKEYYPFWLVKCESYSDPDKWVRFVRHRKYLKKKLMAGSDHFNRDPNKGLDFLQGIHLLPDKLDPQSVALFLRYTSGLDKNLIGDFLGNHDEFCIQVLHEFTGTFDFKDMNLDIALRLFLETFRLPGESQKIQRVLEAFSERYYEQSPQILINKDAALLLSYSLIMLNTDLHNAQVKKKMTEEDFIRNNRRINGGNDLPKEFLSELYYSICKNEIRTIPEQGTGFPEMSFSRWVDLIAKSRNTPPYIVCNSRPFLDHDMFAIMAGPTVAAISVVFDYAEHEDVLVTCIDGFLAVAKVAACHHIEDVLDDLVVALCKFTTLLNTSLIDDPVTAFGEDTRARMATEAIFTIANTYGDYIRNGWRNIVDCILRLQKIGLLPARVTSDATDDPESSDSLFSKPAPSSLSTSHIPSVGTSKRSYGLMGRFSQLLYLDAEESRSQPTEEQLAAQQRALQTIQKCQIGSIFVESKFLQADSLLHLAKALIQSAGRPQKITSSRDDEDTAVFCLDLLIAVTLNNRDRIVLLWQSVYEHIAHIVQSTVMPCNLVEQAVFGLLRICQRLLPYKENLADDLLKSLQLILKLDARVADAYCANITQEVTHLVKANATHIKSQMGWRTITSLLSITARHPDAYEVGFEALVFIMTEGAHLSPANFVLCTEASKQFAESRLGSTDKSIHALDLMSESVTCLARWSHEVKEVVAEAERISEGIREMWLRLVQALRKVCTDQREEVRNHALLSLQRCLIGVEGLFLSASTWLQSFDIIFQLLDDLLEISQSHPAKDYRNMEISLFHGVKLLCKVFLQSLQDLSGLSSFCKLWVGVLSHMEKYMKAKFRGRRTEKIQETIPELLKNMLLVMKASGILAKTSTTGGDSLWELTWLHVNNIAPSLQLEVFPVQELDQNVHDKQKESGSSIQFEGKASDQLVEGETASDRGSQAAG